MPMPDDVPKVLQINFMGRCEESVPTLCLYNFSCLKVSPQLRSDNCQIVIKADKVPSGEHAGRFNAPTVDKFAVIMVGDPADKIKITRRDSPVSIISDLHHSCDALRYTLIFWQWQDEYHINFKLCDPIIGKIDTHLFNYPFL